jgi:hypothetical protein
MEYALGGALLLSLSLMGASRKVFGSRATEWLVPHRADIGLVAFGTVGFSACVALGLVGADWAPGGPMHFVPAALAQLFYLVSLVARGDLPPRHPERLVLLLVCWFGIALGEAQLQVAMQVASLWIVKLRVGSELFAAESAASWPFCLLDAVYHLFILPVGIIFLVVMTSGKMPGKPGDDLHLHRLA